MTDPYSTGTRGEQLLAKYLAGQGKTVCQSDDKTFDLIVDGTYAEVKTSKGPYSALGFIGLTDNQYKALEEGREFNLYIVCTLADPENLEVIKIPATRLRTETPRKESTYYWYRGQLDKLRETEESA